MTASDLSSQSQPLRALPDPAVRRHAHKRTITLDGYARDDGHYDIEAELIDTKSHSFPSRAHGEIKKGTPLHHMKVRVTVCEDMEIIAAQAVTLSGPYHECPHGALAIGNLVGKKIQPGWKKIVARAIGGAQGCTHITELMSPVATVAFQTIYGERAKRKRQASEQANQARDINQNGDINQSGGDKHEMPQMAGMLNSCHALAEGNQPANWLWGIPLKSDETD